MSSSLQIPELMPWPKGINTNWTIVPVPNVPNSLIEQCLSFICGNCFFYDKAQKKCKPLIMGIEASQQILSKPIQLEAVFKEASLGKVTDDEPLFDNKRYQSNPSRQQSLMKDTSFSKLIALTQLAVNSRVANYTLLKCSIMYSLAFGYEQGLHIDDTRDTASIERDGEILSVLFALQDNTKLDIANDKGTRKTVAVPSAFMFLFSGTCLHGGSAFLANNARIHMTFAKSKKHAMVPRDNVVRLVFRCPVKSCECNKSIPVKTMARHQLLQHWRHVHSEKFIISLSKYEKSLCGVNIIRCGVCGKAFNDKRGLRRHVKRGCRGSDMVE